MRPAGHRFFDKDVFRRTFRDLMIGAKEILGQYVGQPLPLATDVLARFAETPSCAPYLVACFERENLLFLSSQFEIITGYSCQKLKSEGLRFWFSVIHPEDRPAVVNRITMAQYELAQNAAPPAEPLLLEYRIQRGDRRWMWIRELKCIASFRDGRKEHILGCFQDIDQEKQRQTAILQEVLRTESCNGLLKVAVSYQNEPCETGNDHRMARASPRITRREREVLKLVANGQSTKQIAGSLFISENTVETHRRRLLEKFGVSNSTALASEAHRLMLV